MWEFTIRPTARRKFEKAYGPDGLWASLFRTEKGYIPTELIRDGKTPGRYLTLDFWATRRDYQRFKKQNRAQYDAIDKECQLLTGDEHEIGQFMRTR
jgi:heme-degrading monooxygenase HmoA